MSKFKQGATSVYTVVIAMLITTVITVSFVRLIVSDSLNTINDELAQAAYNSALAGVEDAKLALKQYYSCEHGDAVLASDGVTNRCSTITTAIKKGFAASDTAGDAASSIYCDAISVALARTTEGSEVPIRESSRANNNFAQAYTCVTIDNTPDDYRFSLDASTPLRAVALRTSDPDVVTGLRISWYSSNDGSFSQLNFAAADSFPQLTTTVATPPIITAQVVQTGMSYTLEQFDITHGDRTNTATTVLVPSRTGTNYLSAQTLLNSNDHSSTNSPQKIRCTTDDSSDFACSVALALPKPIGTGSRRPDTFYLYVSLPYATPNTTVSVQLCTDSDEQTGDCFRQGSPSVASFVDSQIVVDSTGRADDMYSRVEARLEFNDIRAPLPEYALHATDQSGTIDKNFYVTDDCWHQKPDLSVERCNNYGSN